MFLKHSVVENWEVTNQKSISIYTTYSTMEDVALQGGTKGGGLEWYAGNLRVKADHKEKFYFFEFCK